MTKAELVDKVATRLPLPKQQVETVVTLFGQCIMDALHAGDHVEWRGFGSFRLRARRPRTGRNPTVGAFVAISAKQIPWFIAGKALRALVEAPPGQATYGPRPRGCARPRRGLSTRASLECSPART
jgi:integration host factor subunit beta